MRPLTNRPNHLSLSLSLLIKLVHLSLYLLPQSMFPLFHCQHSSNVLKEFVHLLWVQLLGLLPSNLADINCIGKQSVFNFWTGSYQRRFASLSLSLSCLNVKSKNALLSPDHHNLHDSSAEDTVLSLALAIHICQKTLFSQVFS